MDPMGICTRPGEHPPNSNSGADHLADLRWSSQVDVVASATYARAVLLVFHVFPMCFLKVILRTQTSPPHREHLGSLPQDCATISTWLSRPPGCRDAVD